MVTRVIVLDEGLYQGGGLVDRWLGRIGNTMWHDCVAEAPARTGELKAGIIYQRQRLGLRVLSATVGSTAPHTMFVLGGTSGYGGFIYSRGGLGDVAKIERKLTTGVAGGDTRGLWLAFSNPYPGKKFHLRVRGQRPNNFLLKGYARTARTHPSLHPIYRGLLS